MLAILIVGLALVAAITAFVRSRDWAAAAHRENYQQLDIVGQSMENWPNSVEAMARGNFLKDRLQAPPNALQRNSAAWMAGARFDHPDMGTIHLLYRLGPNGPEDPVSRRDTRVLESGMTARIEDPQVGKLQIVHNLKIPAEQQSNPSQCTNNMASSVLVERTTNTLQMTGTLRMDELWQADNEVGLPARDVKRPGPEDYANFVRVIDPNNLFKNPVNYSPQVVCYRLSIPLQRIANIENNAPAFRDIAIVGADGKEVASLGDAKLPVSDLKDIVPSAAEYRELVTKLLVTASRSKEEDPKNAEARLRQEALLAQRSAKPLEVTVAGEPYVAYFRPIKFPVGWNAPDCSRKRDPAGADSTASGSDPGFLAPVDTCLLIGLVPQSEMRARLFRLSPDLLTGIGVLLLLATVLVPAVKLRFLGPAGDMTPLEVGITVFGLVAGVAIVTLAGLAMLDALRLRAQSEMKLEDVSRTLAKHFDLERTDAIGRPTWLPVIVWQTVTGDRVTEKEGIKEQGIPRGGQAILENLGCKFADNSPVMARAVPSEESGAFLALPLASGPDSKQVMWPIREGVSAYGEQGRAFPAFGALAYRCHAGGRAIINQRPYFERAMAGEADGELPKPTTNTLSPERPDNLLPKMIIDKRYTIGAVRAQTDGAAKVIVVNRFSLAAGSNPNSKTMETGPQIGVLLQAFTSRTFLAPVLPRSFSFIVVDASDRQLPYLFGSAPHEIGVSSLRRTLQSSTALAAVDEVAGMTDGAGPVRFSAQFDGVKQNFVARKLAGTPWVLVVYRPVSELDRQLAGTIGLAGALWLGVVVIILASFAVIVASCRLLRLLSKVLIPFVARFPKFVACFRKFVARFPKFRIRSIGIRLPERRIRLWLWPRPGTGATTMKIGLVILAIAIAATLIIWLTDNGVVLAAIAILLPFLAILIAVFWLGNHLRLEREEEEKANPSDQTEAKALLPQDERGFMCMFAALLIACGAVPATACWIDAHADARKTQAYSEIVHLKSAWKANRSALEAIGRNYGLSDSLPKNFIAETPGELKWLGLYGFDPEATVEKRVATVEDATTGKDERDTNQEDPRSAAQLREWMDIGTHPFVSRCIGTPKSDQTRVFCVVSTGTEKGKVGVFVDGEPWFANAWWPGIFVGVLAIAALITVLIACCRGMAKALFGFGVPLDAVQHPDIRVRPLRSLPPWIPFPRIGGPVLPARAVVVNGPLALMNDLLHGDDPLDLSQTADASQKSNAAIKRQLRRMDQDKTVVVTGLDIALKDPELRPGALKALERLSERVEKRAADDEHPLLVVITDLSPLDRILRAFEREQDESRREGSQETRTISRTEQLRWSKLFENFKTCTLPVQPKFLWSKKWKRIKKYLRDLPANQARGVIELIFEVRYLPESVICSLIEPNHVPRPGTWDKMTAKYGIDKYPIAPKFYHKLYFKPIIEWAKSVKPATRAAAQDYLRGEVIEHYQHLWAASSRAERIILDNLARGRVINVDAAIAIRSLIRRGLVRLNPAPQIFNKSFAMFVKQAEKPEALRKWRKDQSSGWDKIARPLGYALPIAVVALAALALLAGESITTVLPLVLGAGPALLSTVLPGRRAD